MIDALIVAGFTGAGIIAGGMIALVAVGRADDWRTPARAWLRERIALHERIGTPRAQIEAALRDLTHEQLAQPK